VCSSDLITVSSNGTTRLADIGSARVYFTGNVDTFNTDQLFGSATPAASMTIAGNALLLGDTNYFWVVYDVDSFAVLGNNLDAEITSMTIGGVPSTPAVTAPAGKKQILLQAVPNIVVATQPFNPIPVYPNSKDNPVVAAKVNMTVGVTSRLTSIRFSLTPNTKLTNISRARLIYTGNDSTFTSSNKLQFGTVPLSVGGVVEFTGNLKLQAGGNYFWLVADINNNAVVLDTLDGVFVGATIQNVVYNPTVGSPAGFRLVENFAYTCNSIPTLLDDEDIGRVQIGNFVNQSVSNLQFFSNPEAFNNYSNFASLPGMEVQVEVPTNYQVNVVNSDATIFNATMNIFVDLNKNGQFDLPNERIVKRNVPSVPATLANRTPAGTFKLPIGTPSGKTFMRVMVIEVTTPGDTLIPCGGTYTWGEVEDYSLNILPAPPGDYYAPIVSNITLSPDSQCVAT